MSVEVDDTEINQDAIGISGGFSWENRYAQSWEILKEDEFGTLQPTLDTLVQRDSEYLRRRRIAADSALRRGIMREIVLLIDWSLSASATDISPFRGAWVINVAVKPFVRDFFEQNPLSQLCLIILRDGLAERICDLSSNLAEHERVLEKLVKSLNGDSWNPKGNVSLQNGLEVALSILGTVPGHGTKEVLFFQISLSTHDPGNILTDTLPNILASKVRFSVVSLAGEVSVAHKIARESGGAYSVALNDAHFVDMVKDQLTPPIITREGRISSYMVPMGFPSLVEYREGMVLCACHSALQRSGFVCPRCASLVCRLPMDCPVCRLSLISAPHLAKSYHHLFPVAVFDECVNVPSTSKCCGCKFEKDSLITEQSVEGFKAGQCTRCSNYFCAHCNHFIHTILHNCPGCLKNQKL